MIYRRPSEERGGNGYHHIVCRRLHPLSYSHATQLAFHPSPLSPLLLLPFQTHPRIHESWEKRKRRRGYIQSNGAGARFATDKETIPNKKAQVFLPINVARKRELVSAKKSSKVGNFGSRLFLHSERRRGGRTKRRRRDSFPQRNLNGREERGGEEGEKSNWVICIFL